MEEENENEEDFQLAGMTEDLVDFGAVSDHEDFDFDVDAAGADRGETTSGAAPEAHRGGESRAMAALGRPLVPARSSPPRPL